jgi:hypothetical protein
MGESSPRQKQISKEKALFNDNRKLLEDFAEAKRMYEDFKRLRKIIGKPVTDKLDPLKIRKDLSGRDFFC